MKEVNEDFVKPNVSTPINVDSINTIGSDENKNLKQKVKTLHLMRVLAFLFFTCLTLFIISIHSEYLINKIAKGICSFIGILSFIFGVYYLYKYTKIKNVKLKKRRFILNVLTILYSVFCISALILLYGPNKSFKNWLITTAMGTMNHKYYCQIFYSDSEINDVLLNNYVEEPDVEFDPSLINIEQPVIEDEASISENSILKDHTQDEIYRIVRFKVNGQDAYMAAIYDPSKISVAYTRSLNQNGEFVTSMAKRKKALVAVNGGRFKDINFKGNGSTPAGVTISNGKIISDYEYKNSMGVIGLNKNNILVLYKKKHAQELIDLGVRDAVTSKPFLIVNGKPSFIRGNGGYGFDARTAIGQRKDGIILLLVVDANDTRTNGASMKDLTDIMLEFKAVNAAALDGGTSSVMVEKGILINDPINSSLKHMTRPVATSLVVTE